MLDWSKTNWSIDQCFLVQQMHYFPQPELQEQLQALQEPQEQLQTPLKAQL